MGLAVLAHYLGDDDRAVSAAEEALARWTALDDPGGIAVAQMIFGFIAEDRGDYATAERFLEQAIASSEVAKARGGTPALIPAGLTPGTVAGWCWFHFGVVYLGMEQLGRATAAWEKGLELFRADGHSWGVSVCLGYLGLLAVVTGDLARSAALQRQSLDLRWAVGPQEDFAGCLSDAALLAASGGHYQQAARLFGSVTSLRAVAGGNWRLPERTWYERALEECRTALGAAVFETAFASGRDLSLVEAAAEASGAIDAATAPPAPFPAPAPSAAASEHIVLTQREIEVLKLLAAGRSTPEMAELMFISPRTVGTHVANLLAKLGVDSRAEAVAYAFRHNIV
jgi:DNA-binding CsgD family transcriptional regulator